MGRSSASYLHVRSMVFHPGWTLALAALALAAVLAAPVAAHAAVTYSEWSPPDGGIQSTPFRNSGGWMYPAYPFQVRATTTAGETIATANCTMTIDGVTQPLRAFTTGTNVLIRGNYGSEWAPADGPHTAAVSVRDSGGATTVDTWTFDTAVAPVVPPMWFYMANGYGEEYADFSQITVQRPTFGIAYDDANDLASSLSIVVLIDGATVYTGFDPDANEAAYPNTFYWTPSSDLAAGAHTVTFLVSDTHGNVGTGTWGFTIAAAAPMSEEPACESCHTDQPEAHPVDNCAACHPALADDYGGNTPHDYGYIEWYTTTYGCDGVCHNEANPWVPQHTDAEVAAGHLSTTAGTCTMCHDTDLLLEHAKYPAGSEFKYQCSTCHFSSDAAVQSAISAKQTACDACHSLAPGHGDPSAAHVDVIVPACVECHGSDLVNLHIACDSCHPGGGAAAAGATCVTCHPGIDLRSHGAGPFFQNAAENPSAPGYLSWSWAVANAGETAGSSPHGNYTTTSNKCAVCHSVHQAVVGGVALTAIPEAGYATYTDACTFCHASGSTFTNKVVMADINGTIAPHTNCWRCHIESPHGAGASEFEVLSGRLLNDDADHAIELDLADAGKAAVLTAAGVDFHSESDAEGLVIGTGYVCGGCHGGSANAFAVAGDDYAPTAVDHTTNVAVDDLTGHRVLAMNTATWNRAGEYGAFYTGGGVAGADSTVAFNPANSCKACHDQKLADGTTSAFPHGYVNSAGAYVGKVAGAGFIWLSMAADANDSRVVLERGASSNGAALLTQDGLCIKCHVSGDRSSGVGITF